MIYLISCAVIAAHLVLVSLLIRRRNHLRNDLAILALTIWVLPSTQIYFSGLVGLTTKLFGEAIGYYLLQWGRTILFLGQLSLGGIVISQWRKGERANQSK